MELASGVKRTESMIKCQNLVFDTGLKTTRESNQNRRLSDMVCNPVATVEYTRKKSLCDFFR